MISINKIENDLKDIFARIDEVALFNQKKVLEAFRINKISDWHFAHSTGYGYDDLGRQMLSKLIATIFDSESCIASPLITSGTHAISLMFYATLFPGDILLSITGKPYDTLSDVISKKNTGSLADYKIKYKEIVLKNSEFDYEQIEKELKEEFIKCVFVTRSRGYSLRNSLSINKIKEAIAFVKKISPNTLVLVDNCYGEFVEELEPTQVGADLVAGSLIKNLGGGIAPTGGYVAGKEELVNLAANRLTAPSLGFEVGSYKTGYNEYFEGLFLSPVTVKNALRSAVLFASCFSDLGYTTIPEKSSIPFDVIVSIILKDKKKLLEFCRLIQKYSPVNSNVVPEPYQMPGYEDEIIMAAGTFVQGASIELTADAPIKNPFVVYLQGGLTYEHSKIVLNELLNLNIF